MRKTGKAHNTVHTRTSSKYCLFALFLLSLKSRDRLHTIPNCCLVLLMRMCTYDITPLKLLIPISVVWNHFFLSRWRRADPGKQNNYSFVYLLVFIQISMAYYLYWVFAFVFFQQYTHFDCSRVIKVSDIGFFALFNDESTFVLVYLMTWLNPNRN